MKLLIRLIALAMLLAAGSALALDKLTVGGAWIPKPVPKNGHTDVYLSIVTGHQPDSLLAAASPAGQRVEIRRYSQVNSLLIKGRKEDGVSQINIPANTRADLEPDRLHLKLFYAMRDLNPGDEIPVSLKFQNAGVVTVMAKVVKWGKS